MSHCHMYSLLFYFSYLYFTDVDGVPGTHKLFRANMDGSEDNILLSNLSNPGSKYNL